MKNHLKSLCVFSLLLASFTFASTVFAESDLNPTISAQTQNPQWNQLIQKAIAKGEKSDQGFGTFLSLTNVTPVGTAPEHRAEYFSVVGGYALDGTFGVGHVEVVSEVWTVNKDGNWDIDQWLFSSTRDGQLTETLHYHLIEKQNREVLADDYIQSKPDEENQKWSERLNAWYAL